MSAAIRLLSRPVHAILCACAWIPAPFAAAQGDSEATDPKLKTAAVESAVKRGRELLEAGRAEEAAQVIRGALRDVEDVKPAAKSLTLKNQALAAIRKADPRWKERTAASGEAASALLEIAERDRMRGWNSTALEMLELVEYLDPKAAQKQLGLLRATGGNRPRSAFGTKMPMDAWFRDVEILWEYKRPWAATADALRSPRLEGPQDDRCSSLLLTPRAPRLAEYYIACRAQVPLHCVFGIVFGAKDEFTGIAAQIRRRAETNGIDIGECVVSLERMTERKLIELASSFETLTASERTGLVEVRIEVRGVRVRARLEPSLWVEADVSAEWLAGSRIGFYVSGKSAHREPIEFRDLEIGPLPPLEVR